MEIGKVLKKTGYTSIITSIILGVLGLVMFLYSEATMKVIACVLGVILIITGITITANKTNKDATGIVKIVKIDKETGNVSQGDASLENAIYKIYAREDIYAQNKKNLTKKTIKKRPKLLYFTEKTAPQMFQVTVS